MDVAFVFSPCNGRWKCAFFETLVYMIFLRVCLLYYCRISLYNIELFSIWQYCTKRVLDIRDHDHLNNQLSIVTLIPQFIFYTWPTLKGIIYHYKKAILSLVHQWPWVKCWLRFPAISFANQRYNDNFLAEISVLSIKCTR